MSIRRGSIQNPAVREVALGRDAKWILEELYCSPVFNLPTDGGRLVAFSQLLGGAYLNEGDTLHQVLNPPVFESSSSVSLFQLLQAQVAQKPVSMYDPLVISDGELELQRHLILLVTLFAFDYIVLNSRSGILYVYDHEQTVSVFGRDKSTLTLISSRIADFLKTD